MGWLRNPALWALLLAGVGTALLTVALFRRASPSLPAPAPPQVATRPVAAPRALVGAGSCSSSGCHAGDPSHTEHPGRSAYSVWATRDRHARAEQVLHEPLAAEIVAALAKQDPRFGREPAAENRACIGCHATARDALASDGVSCESCHGGAGDWLVAHTLPGWQTAGNALGMVDLADPFTCAQRCAECHVGGPPTNDGFPREVTHDFLAAGHPRLAFELRSFKAAEPPHWRDRFASAAGGAAADEARAEPDPFVEWALGRRGTLHAYLTLLSAQANRAAGAPRPGEAPAESRSPEWPEFTAFDCYSCHRLPLNQQPRPLPPDGLLPGTPRLEPLPWALLEVACSAEQASVLAGFRKTVEQRWWMPPSAATLQSALQSLDRVPGSAATTTEPAGQLARRIVAGIDPANWDEAAAALQALDALAAREERRGMSAADAAALRGRLGAVRQVLEFATEERPDRTLRFNSPHQFDAGAVTQELDRLARLMETLPVRP